MMMQIYERYYNSAIYFMNKTNRQFAYRTPTKKADSQIKVTASPLPSPSTANTSSLYFCHYKNAMYMGGIKSFKKDGRGILIHDNGVSIISNYFNDQMHGHNIFFAQHCLLSAEFNKGKLVEAVYRTDGFLAHLYFNADEILQGKCKLFNYTSRTITYSTFKKGTMAQREEETQTVVLNRVFDLGQLDFLIGKVHAKALKYDIERVNSIIAQKYGNKLTVGFDKSGLINGLGFTIIFRGIHGGFNPETHRHEDQFQLKIVERGYLVNSQLNGFGQKLFKNGNQYIGEFKNGVFEGNGVLVNKAKKNWVSGYFSQGNLIDLFEYNSEGVQKKYDKIVEALHERKTNWINNEITVLMMDQFDRLIEKIINDNPTSAVKSLEQRKQEVLKRIQQNFICDTGSTPNYLENVKSDLKVLNDERQKGRQTVKNYVQSFIPQQSSASKANDQNRLGITPKVSSFKRTTQIRKSKIFDKNTSVDRYLRIEDVSTSRKKSSRLTPQPKKKIFGQTATTGYKLRSKMNPSEQNSPDRNRVNESESREDEWDSSSGIQNRGIGQNSMKSESRDSLINRKMVGKSKIFNAAEKQNDQITPKFIYTKVDTVAESEKRVRIGLEQAS